MSNKFKEIEIKSSRHYFFDDIISLKNLDPNIVKIDKKSNKSILIHYIGHVTVKSLRYIKVNSVNPLNFIYIYIYVYIKEMVH